jgi:ubiquinone/menaquinone biosynthesis C-methylase UbiE
MSKGLDEIREQQKASWNRFAAAWKKWDPVTMEFLQPMKEAIISYLQPKDGQKILDIAAGTGEPALSIAASIKGGCVTITDISEEMLNIANEKAKTKNISNIETVLCDATKLPFDNSSFDAVSCRFGFMFFPDMQLAANEIWRVLKPGGRFATTVWNFPEKNFWVTAIMGTIMRLMDIPPPPPEEPGMFRCCKPGRMRHILEEAGFRKIEEKEVLSTLKTKSVDEYWEMMTEIGASVVAALSQADDGMRSKIKEEVFGLIKQKCPEVVALEASAMIITARK